jgi:hypothetical protein
MNTESKEQELIVALELKTGNQQATEFIFHNPNNPRLFFP